MVSERTFEKIENLAKEPIEAVFTDPTYGKVRVFLLQDEFGDFTVFHYSCYISTGNDSRDLISISLNIMFPIVIQFERGEALEKITQDVKRTLEEEGDEEGLKILPKTVDTVRKQVCLSRLKFIICASNCKVLFLHLQRTAEFCFFFFCC